jgi:hypothetical protein
MNFRITPPLINRKINSNPLDPTYWTRRREWWAAEAKREGVDWPGVIKTQIEVADFLARLRKRGAV